MSEDLKPPINGQPEKKTHPHIRYERAVVLAEEMLKKHPEGVQKQHLVDLIEDCLLAGELRGLGAAQEFMNYRMSELRRVFREGHAKHIQDATAQLAMWVQQSSNFVHYERPVVVDESAPKEPGSDRKFFRG
jgi:hypothetical protein